VAVVVATEPVAAQSPDRRHDVGATVTWLNLNGLDQTAGGLGGRVGTHLVDLLWLDAEANVFPTDDPVTDESCRRSPALSLEASRDCLGFLAR
jgi:hypothetical protein